MTTTAAGAGGAIVSGSHAGFAAVQGFGYAAGSAATGGAQEEDSLRFSRQIQENIGDWRLDDVFRPKLFQAIRARTTLDVEVVGAAANFERILADMKQSDPEQFEQSEQVRNMKLSSTVWNSDVVSWDMRQAAQRGDPPCKQIEMNLGVILTGESRPEANITLMWFVQEDDDSAEKSGADNEPFKLVDVNQAARSQRKKYITNNRFYVISSAGHSRKDWTANGCALLKREVEKAINELCAKMAKDMFP